MSPKKFLGKRGEDYMAKAEYAMSYDGVFIKKARSCQILEAGNALNAME